ncbi:MAG: sigma-70 family RNA polymerase sigma factor [Verrucomicrobia bacterium]|nr:sigma-70 family RNA polymerase sigma factor [Verrucomicrobiota bacterium]
MPDKSFDPIPTRHSLLNRLKDWGDQTSWQDFFDTYWQLIYNVAVKAGLSDAEAQEVVQETVIAVARKIGEFKADPAHGSFSAWLMQLTRWRIADQWRKRAQAGVQASACPPGFAAPGTLKCELQRDDTGSTADIERIPDPASRALDTVWQEEWERHLMAAALERVKQQVSPRQFQMFDLHVRQKLSVQETARTLQASMASVYMAKHRVARLVKKEVDRLKTSEA